MTAQRPNLDPATLRWVAQQLDSAAPLDSRGWADYLRKLADKPSKLQSALGAWATWYSRKLRRISSRPANLKSAEAYSGAEQDLFEALGCVADE